MPTTRKSCEGCGGVKPPGRSRRYCDACTAKPAGCKHCGGPKPKGRGRRLCESCTPRDPVWVRGVPRPCRVCGSVENKLKGKQMCEDCRALARWRNQRRSTVRKHRRLPCKGCGRVKPPGRARLYCAACLVEKSRPRPCCRCGERPARAKGAKLCWECKGAADERNRERRAELERERWRRRRARTDLGHRDMTIRRETSRIAYRVKMLRQGVVVAPVDRVDQARGESLPGRPLAAVIDALAERRKKISLFVVDADNLGDLKAVCEQAGLVEREVYRWRVGEGNPTLSNADLALTRLGLAWWDVWNEDTVRVPAFVVRTYRFKASGRRFCHRRVAYGDLGPDLAELERIGALLTGELVAA